MKGAWQQQRMCVVALVNFRNGLTIPKVSFGTWQASNNEVKPSVLWALGSGYRHIDTAQRYKNEEEDMKMSDGMTGRAGSAKDTDSVQF
ncbi:hypothetical protein [Alkalibacterium sp. 20]|uniref:hypothetical protein n=1 Tax=Alkalibacterium sp. 20 TaxID=1798803 RepID=UPI000900268C|nr:hypothetical protein [Alkalibacterium sp. 20]OJF94744.1 hypothetical protein AX762_07265 [Alkalibacterium sp. 20]